MVRCLDITYRCRRCGYWNRFLFVPVTKVQEKKKKIPPACPKCGQEEDWEIELDPTD